MINGNFDIWQRAARQTRGGYGSADRWFVDAYNVNSLYMERVECTGLDTFAATYYARVGGVMADVYCYMFLQHRIENGFSILRGKDATLSFWVRLSKPTVLEVTIRGTKFYYPKGGQYLRNLGTGWQKVVLHFDFKDCTEIGNARVYIGTPGDAYHAWGEAGGYMDIAQVQLEIGEVATEFEYRPIGLELMLCQRYFECFNASDVAWIKCRGSKLYGQLLTTQRFTYTRKRTLPSVRFTGSYSCGAYNDYGQTWFFSDGVLSPYWLTDSGCHLRITSASYTFLSEDYLLCISQDNNNPFRIEVDAEL